MMRYLLDTNFLAAYVQGRPGANSLVRPWLLRNEVATSMLVYAEVEEYLLVYLNGALAHRWGARCRATGE